ncbi:hypothetical protein H6G97_40285 [Nostoc flagelliforme FACHB-838]|uniref:Uncharacterized protein n=1 Tax=Nostoc flagelliforme FACHB-838 TaxID=2692904 RepID=A0ABR8E0N7_9NOSO|nr:hypothetical protein [Nostoc flagelliforme]MBD2535307.1 hypothetical protein [Nostoc flagelliforme FACHB-838]
MSEIQNRVQLMTIPAPIFQIGEMVEWTLDGETKQYTMRGSVVGRIYTESFYNDVSVWEYAVEIIPSLIVPRGNWKIGFDTVEEFELQKYVVQPLQVTGEDDSEPTENVLSACAA